MVRPSQPTDRTSQVATSVFEVLVRICKLLVNVAVVSSSLMFSSSVFCLLWNVQNMNTQIIYHFGTQFKQRPYEVPIAVSYFVRDYNYLLSVIDLSLLKPRHLKFAFSCLTVHSGPLLLAESLSFILSLPRDCVSSSLYVLSCSFFIFFGTEESQFVLHVAGQTRKYLKI